MGAGVPFSASFVRALIVGLDSFFSQGHDKIAEAALLAARYDNSVAPLIAHHGFGPDNGVREAAVENGNWERCPGVDCNCRGGRSARPRRSPRYGRAGRPPPGRSPRQPGSCRIAGRGGRRTRPPREPAEPAPAPVVPPAVPAGGSARRPGGACGTDARRPGRRARLPPSSATPSTRGWIGDDAHSIGRPARRMSCGRTTSGHRRTAAPADAPPTSARPEAVRTTDGDRSSALSALAVDSSGKTVAARTPQRRRTAPQRLRSRPPSAHRPRETAHLRLSSPHDRVLP